MSPVPSGFFANGARFLGLTFKGRGTVNGALGADAVLNYSTVAEGAAPVAGDLVVWNNMIYYATPSAANDLTGSGWTQSGVFAGGSPGSQHVVLAKTVISTDISSPPTLAIGSGVNMIAGLAWFAYTISGRPPTLAVGDHTNVYTGASGPTARSVDSTALNPPAVSITLGCGLGTDGSITMSGITFDKTSTLTNFSSSSLDLASGIKLDVGGAAYTISKTDDDTFNALGAAYISAS